MDSILTSVKKVLGIESSYTHFDEDIIIHINSAFFILNQLGVGSEEPFTIEDESATWRDFVSGKELELVRSYVYLRVRLLFDPPTNSFAVDAIKKQIEEFEWRLEVGAENNKVK